MLPAQRRRPFKDFGVVYGNVPGEVRLAPVYASATSTLYLLEDPLALTHDGKPGWTSRVRSTLDRVTAFLDNTTPQLRAYQKENACIHEIGVRMLSEWRLGIKHSLLAA